MPPRSTVSLDELLALCEQRHLIDTFEKCGHDVIIRLGYARHRLSAEVATRFLQGVLRYETDLHTISALFAHAVQLAPAVPAEPVTA